MREAKLSVRNNIANTTEAHARELSWKTQEEGLQQEVAILYRNDPLKLLPRGFLRIIGGGVPLGSPNPDPISDQKCQFSTRLQTCPSTNYFIIIKIRTGTKTFLKINLEFAYFSFFLPYLELKRWIRSDNPVVRSITVPDSRPKWARSIPVFRLKRRKTLPFGVGGGGAHTYMA